MTNEKKEQIANCRINSKSRLKMLISILLFIVIDVGIFVGLFFVSDKDYPFIWIMSQFVIVFILPWFVNLFIILKGWVKTGEFMYYSGFGDKLEFIKKYLFGDWRK